MNPAANETEPRFLFDDRGVTVEELERLLDAMDGAVMPFPAAAVFHRSLRSPEKETASLRHTLSCTLRDDGARKVHQNYYLPMTTAMAVALFE